MDFFHGRGKRRAYFEGWYFKQQNESRCVALIPAWHIGKDGRASASIQAITNEGAWRAVFPPEQFQAERDRFHVRIGGNSFGYGGVNLALSTPSLEIEGTLGFSPFLPPRGDVMGPFAHVPFMQCRHAVLSLTHRVEGSLRINGERYAFTDGLGYIEGDRGVSFPSSYLWTQCSFRGGPYDAACSILLSIAAIPFCGARFTGCIAAVYDGRTEHRLATYRGVRILHYSSTEAVIAQGPYRLEVRLLDAKCPKGLFAPQSGDMSRIIHESAASTVHYRFTYKKTALIDVVSHQAGFEYSDISP